MAFELGSVAVPTEARDSIGGRAGVRIDDAARIRIGLACCLLRRRRWLCVVPSPQRSLSVGWCEDANKWSNKVVTKFPATVATGW